MRNLKVTSLEELREIGEGAIIPLPSFDGENGKEFVVRVKRPSIMGLLSQGKIPNGLRSKVEDLFGGNTEFVQKEGENLLGDMYEVMNIFASECLIEPSYKDLEECNVSLTDAQLIVIFNYAQQGMSAVGDFRSEQTNTKPINDGKDLQ